MRKIISLFLLFIFAQVSTASAESKTYVRFDYGTGRFKNEKMDALNVVPSGPTYGFAFGGRVNSVELGLFYRNVSFESDINHDSVANQIIHKGKSYGLDMSIFLNKQLSLKLGYALNSYEEQLATAVSSTALSAIRTTYGLNEDYSSANVFYGVNYEIFGGKKYDTYLSLTHFPMGDGLSTTSLQLGFRMYMDGSFSNMFGR